MISGVAGAITVDARGLFAVSSARSTAQLRTHDSRVIRETMPIVVNFFAGGQFIGFAES